jgi:hypothetical protein
VWPVTGSAIRISTCAIACPTVAQRCSRVSSIRTIVVTGEISVMPKAIETSEIPMSAATRFITSTGQRDPAITPVRSEPRSNSPKRGCWSIAMNIVGTP